MTLQGIDGHKHFPLSRPTPMNAFFDGFQNIGGEVARAAFFANTGGHIFNQHILPLDLAVKADVLLHKRSSAILASFAIPKSHISPRFTGVVLVNRNDSHFHSPG